MGKSKTRQQPAVPAELASHLDHLGFYWDYDAYMAWCAEHRFPVRGPKPRHRLEAELLTRRREQFERSLHDARGRQLRVRQHLLDAVHGRDGWDGPVYGQIRQLAHDLSRRGLRDALGRAIPNPREAFGQLLVAVSEKSGLLSLEPVVPELGHGRRNHYVGALAALAALNAHWVRPLADWRCSASSPARVFHALLHHLLARYPVPAFMDTAFFEDGREGELHRRWFVQLGAGESARALEDVPLALSRRMRHLLLTAPDGFTVTGALRRAQVLGHGGDGKLVRAVLGSKLARLGQHEDFWDTVIQFLAGHTDFPRSQVGPLVDFLEAQRHTHRQVRVGRTEHVTVPPPQPGFGMKGRTTASLLRLMRAWHEELAERPGLDRHAWAPCTVGGLEDGWTIRELLDSEALQAEGKAMHHCVASYNTSCAKGTSAIFSLRDRAGRRSLTLEVHLQQRQLVQARGPCNALPNAEQWAVVRRWAAEQRVAIASYVTCE